MASYCPSRSFWMRVGTFPRNASMRKSGCPSSSWFFRRMDEVPTTPSRRTWKGVVRSTDSGRTSTASSTGPRGGTAATTRPAGGVVSRSLWLCTARSTSPSRRACSISFVKNPLPSILSKLTFWIWSPRVLSITTSTVAPWACNRSRTWFACQRARSLPRVPMRMWGAVEAMGERYARGGERGQDFLSCSSTASLANFMGKPTYFFSRYATMRSTT